MTVKITPELDVSDIEASLAFYVDIIGFKVKFQRLEEAFAYLDLDGAYLMLQEAEGPGRRFRTAPLEYPYGRGMNLQIEVADVGLIYDRLVQKGYQPYLDLEEKWYRQDDIEAGNKQFVIEDPDGFLLRFFEDLGNRPLS